MFCHNCGKQVPENVNFCIHCGAAQTIPSVQNQPKVKSAPSQQPAPQQPAPQQSGEKALKSYVGATGMRNAFFVLLALTAASLPVMPPTAIGFGVFAAICGISWVVQNSRINKKIAQMQADGTYSNLLREFANASSMNNDKVRYSENYIFGKSSGAFYRYTEVLWLYRHNYRYLFIPIRSDIMLGNSAGRIQSFCKLRAMGKTGNEEIKALAALVLKKNPQVLLGFDATKQAEYKRRTK